MSTKVAYTLMVLALVISAMTIGMVIERSRNSVRVFEVAYQPPQEIVVIVQCGCCCSECGNITPELPELELTAYSTETPTAVTSTSTPEPGSTVEPTPTIEPTPQPTVTPNPTKVKCNKGGGNGGEDCDPGRHPEKGNDDETTTMIKVVRGKGRK